MAHDQLYTVWRIYNIDPIKVYRLPLNLLAAVIMQKRKTNLVEKTFGGISPGKSALRLEVKRLNNLISIIRLFTFCKDCKILRVYE